MAATHNDDDVGPADSEWYWDLDKQIAVPADSRGPADQTLGPYPSKAEAEHWKATTERRNESWDADDDAWDDDTAPD